MSGFTQIQPSIGPSVPDGDAKNKWPNSKVFKSGDRPSGSFLERMR